MNNVRFSVDQNTRLPRADEPPHPVAGKMLNEERDDEAAMTDTTSRRVGRPNTRVLSPELIVETALGLLDRHGEHGFNMRDIARELGVRPSALYNHVASKDDIYRGIREFIAERIARALPDDEAWDVTIASWARGYRATFAAHPPTVALLAVMPISPTSKVSVFYEHIVRKLHEAGWGRGEALSILVALESFILGSALDAAAAPDMMHPGTRTDVPTFSAAYAERDLEVAASGTSPADLAFETGLRLILNGLRAEADARASDSGPK